MSNSLTFKIRYDSRLIIDGEIDKKHADPPSPRPPPGPGYGPARDHPPVHSQFTQSVAQDCVPQTT